jgi:hypothetical protein
MPNYFLRKSVKEALDGIDYCTYCGSTQKLTIDHIHPQAKGGGNNIENLTKACGKCNSLKSTYSLDEFLGRMIDKRECGLNKFYSYSGRFRKHKKRNTQPDFQAWLLKKMIEIRTQHRYYSIVIGSIVNQRYRIF